MPLQTFTAPYRALLPPPRCFQPDGVYCWLDAFRPYLPGDLLTTTAPVTAACWQHPFYQRGGHAISLVLFAYPVTFAAPLPACVCHAFLRLPHRHTCCRWFEHYLQATSLLLGAATLFVHNSISAPPGDHC